jgi:hypothetical protein
MTRAKMLGLTAVLVTVLVVVAVVGANQFGLSLMATTPQVSPTPEQSATAEVEVAEADASPTPKQVNTIVPTVIPTIEATVPEHDMHSVMPTSTPTSTIGVIAGAPYQGAPLCPDIGEAHDHHLFHTLWDSVRGCHYDHEHGQNPFTPEVTAAFPGFDLRTLLGPGAGGVGHTNPSSPMENTDKHGGFKWNVQLEHAEGCAPFEGSTLGVNGSVIQYHGWGNYTVELEASVHSVAALLRQCYPDNPTDYGYMYVVQHVNYGQRVTPYQGTILPYPNSPVPAYESRQGPYLSIDCVGDVPQCRESIEFIRNRNANVFSNWTTKPASTLGSESSSLLQLFFRLRDGYQVFDWRDFEYPFTFLYVCSPDGLTYDPRGCAYNNSTTQVHEVAGTIPAAWDNLDGFDSDPEVGRITAEGFVTRFGELNLSCVAPGDDCDPIKLVRAFVGNYGSVLVYTEGKGQNIVPYLPERDIYFCDDRVCAEGDVGAVPSGWLGPNN